MIIDPLLFFKGAGQFIRGARQPQANKNQGGLATLVLAGAFRGLWRYSFTRNF